MKVVFDIKVPRKHPDYLKHWRNRSRRYLLLVGAKYRAKRDGHGINISLEDIPDIPKQCPVLKIPLHVHEGVSGWHDDSPSLDRIDSSKGYLKNNIRIISNRANRLKADATLEELEKILEDARLLRY